MKQFMKRSWSEEGGQDLTEYALLLVLLVLTAIGSLNALATVMHEVFSKAGSNLNT